MTAQRQQRRGIRAAALVLAGSLFLAGCGGPQEDGGQAGAAAGGTAPESAAAPESNESASSIMVENAWARPAMEKPDLGVTSAAYFTLHNHGRQDDALIGASTDVAGKTELHETVPVEPKAENKMGGQAGNGMGSKMPAMKMRSVGKVPLPAGGSVEFRPGGLHVMFMDLKDDFAVGDRFRLTLKFEQGEPQTIEVVVRQP